MRILYSGGPGAIRPFATFCQQSEPGFCPIRRTLQRRIQSFLYLWFRNDPWLLAPVSDGAGDNAQVLRE
jgi:hypothetical protein